MKKHDHEPPCVHERLKYCAQCRVAYCENCGAEWVGQQAAPKYRIDSEWSVGPTRAAPNETVTNTYEYAVFGESLSAGTMKDSTSGARAELLGTHQHARYHCHDAPGDW